jgi:membrane protease YdiL (CAAX protease family)
MRLLIGAALVFALFQWVATALGSDRGQAGLLVGAIVVSATLAAECLLFGTDRSRGAAPRFRRAPVARRVAAGGASALLLLVFPGYRALTETSFEIPGVGRLPPGLFAQAGIAEEVLFRGYLFGHVREGRPFWRAAMVSCAAFVAVHLFMFLTLPWPIALASVLLAAVLSLPLAYLFELGGRTIWAPAFLHFIVQGAVKVIVPVEESPRFPLVWIAASATLPFAVLLIPRRSEPRKT